MKTKINSSVNQRLKIAIGLGNPGKSYAKTYHNAGLLFIEYSKGQNLLPMHFTLFASDVFMNESGRFVAETLRKTGAKPEEMLIIHDDSDIEIGKFKLSFGQSSAGHKGVESVIMALGTKNFWRLRIGVRSPQNEGKSRKKADEFVLKKIGKYQEKIIKKVFGGALLKISEISD